MNTLIKNYNEALQKIYDHVGFKEDWVIFPIDDCFKMYWTVSESSVFFAESIKDLCSTHNYYTDTIYKQRFYKKWIYEGKDFTLIFCDTHTDGMKYFRLFDNNKKVKYQDQKSVWEEIEY